MNKEFRFPRAAAPVPVQAAIAEEPSSAEAEVTVSSQEEESVEDMQDQGAGDSKPFEVTTTTEVFSPPVVSKEEVPVPDADDDDGDDDDVGPTVEVDLS